jgi:hypothetical protein
MDNPWQVAPEEEYLASLEHERHMFAWCLVQHGSFTPEAAAQKALDFYQYEPPEEEHRGLVFHDEAWHWAMLGISPRYWRTHPELAHASDAYRAESRRFNAARA